MEIQWGIRRKLVAILTLCALLFVLVSAPVISYLSYESYKTNADQQQARLVGAVRVSAAIAAFVRNEEIGNEVLNGLLQDDEILAVELNGLDGYSLSASSNGLPTASLSEHQLTDYPLFSPIDEDKKIGGIRIWSNNQLISDRATKLVQNDIAWLISLSFILTMASIMAANILVGTPLRELAEQLEKARPENHNPLKVSNIHKQDEIGLVARSVNNFLDITAEALHTERELRYQIEKMNKHYSNIFSSSHVGIMVLDEKGLLLHHNPVLLERIVKLSEAQHAQSKVSDFFSLIFRHPDKAWHLVSQARLENETVSGDLELSASWREPCWVHCLLTINREVETLDEIIECVLYDITRRIKETQLARQQAEENPLTGLQNRRGCENFINALFQNENDLENTVVMLLDLDEFKPINDTYGHSAGDLVLQTIAQRLLSSVRASTDLVGRIGGDEFVIVLKSDADDREQIELIASAIIEQVSEPIEIGSERPVSVGVSMGIATARDFDSLETLLKAADSAMYRVKSRGKNNYVFANQ